MTSPRLALTPPNATPLERVLGEAGARLLDLDADVIRRSRIGATAPKSLLTMLAAERSLHHPSDEEATQRARIDASFDDHRRYGSPAALEAEIAADTGQTVRVIEYFERADLSWPDFMVEALIAPGDAAPDLAPVVASTLRRKNVRDHLAKARVRASQPAAALVAGAATHVSPRLRILPEGQHKPAPQVFVGASTRALPRVAILPQRIA